MPYSTPNDLWVESELHVVNREWLIVDRSLVLTLGEESFYSSKQLMKWHNLFPRAAFPDHFGFQPKGPKQP